MTKFKCEECPNHCTLIVEGRNVEPYDCPYGGSDCPWVRLPNIPHWFEVEEEVPKENDPVNHPNHYCEGRKYEPWDVIIDWKLDYLTGTAVKYLSRAGRKDPNKEIEDLQKAVAYINKRIEQLEAKKDESSVLEGTFKFYKFDTKNLGRETVKKALLEPTLLENSFNLLMKEFAKNLKKLNEDMAKRLEEEDERTSVS